MTAAPDERADDEDEGHGGGRYDIGHVSGSVGTSVKDPQAPVHAGSGDQYITIVRETVREAVRSRRWVTDDQVQELAPRFVPPPGWEDARRVLRNRNTVLLKGGSGRRSAALSLLVDSDTPDGHILDLPWEAAEVGRELLAPADVTAGGRLLLDLRGAEDERFQAVQRELETFRGTVLEQRAFLVVVLPDRWQHHVLDEFQSLVVTVGRPDGTAVLRRHLEVQGLRSAPGEIEELARSLGIGDLAVGEVTRLASLAGQAHTVDPSASTADLLRHATQALAQRGAEVAAWVGRHPSAQARALMLTVAMFAEHSGDAVFEADRRLRDALGCPRGQFHELQLPDLGSRLVGVGARLDEAGVVRFTSLNYSDAVRTHFWTHFPGLRDAFREWVIACGRSPGVDRTFVRRFGAECLRVGRPGDLTAAAKAWADRGPSNKDLAAAALEHGLVDRHWRSWFRQQLYTWSRDSALDTRLAHTVVVVCAGVLAGSWPASAMVRLHHFTGRHHDDGVRRAAADALVELAGDAMFLRRFLIRLNEQPFHRLRHEVSRGLFLRVAEPSRLTDATCRTRPLVDDPSVSNELVTAWRRSCGGWRGTPTTSTAPWH